MEQFDDLLRLLEADDVKHEADLENHLVMTGFRGKTALFRVYLKLDEDEQLLQLFGIAPVAAPQGCKSAIAETIVRANYGLKVGKFEMDFRDGEVRFQIGMVLSAGRLDDELVRRLLATTVHMLDRYFPAFMSVIYGNDLPEDAIRHVEQLTE